MRKRFGYINVTGLIVAVLLFGYAVSTSTPAVLLQSAEDVVAAVGVSIAVAPNQYNTTAQQLSDKQKQLDQREAALNDKEQAIAQSGGAAASRYGLYSLCLSALLVVLVAINFYLDNRRTARAEPKRTFSVDLR